ncbi:MAG: hypothetical protein KH128_10825 [Firmicutes bacterium]|nr:hypothetical protein [Bacillota bacterium]
MMVAALESAKLALSFLPNIELVTLLIILFTLTVGKKIYYAVFAFVVLEGLLYGFGIWWVMYLYMWPLLAWVTWLLRRKKDVWTFALLSGAFGLGFGAMCAVPYLFVGGINTAFAWWVSGIPFDIIHGISNFVLMLILYKPLRKVLEHGWKKSREA